jgi:DNA-binding MarR family transcriptional regulator
MPATAPDPVSDPAPATLAADLRVSLMRAVRRLRAEKSDSDITDGQYCVLATLDRLGPRTPRELADQERVQPPSMTRTVNALAEARLVVRAADPDDGRQVIVDLTESGRDHVRETRRRRDAWLARRLADLTPAERAVLADASDILRRITHS